MPDAVFRERPSFGANVGNRPIGAAPPVGVPRGPSGFPCSALCPPDPPTPLTVVAITTGDFEAITVGYRVTFDAQPYVTGEVNWTVDVGTLTPGVIMTNLPANSFFLPVQAADDTELTIPADSPGVRSATGGAVVAGVFPIPFPPP
jgi:hypothetical protein